MSVTLPAALLTPSFRAGESAGSAREDILDQARELDQFLKEVEKRALRIAEIAVRDGDEALDIVQEAMIQLVRRYASRPSAEWRPLFYRILKNRIHDWQRRRVVRSRVIAWWTGGQRDEEIDPIDTAESPSEGPSEALESEQAMSQLESSLKRLPPRQQQAFMLRNFEGLDVAATAVAMGCSEGSVKTHYFRAVQTLREELGEHWP
jgi:RNA polymerase sigma-70 factor (ECF subfamily)